jgi:hypothetical protein
MVTQNNPQSSKPTANDSQVNGTQGATSVGLQQLPSTVPRRFITVQARHYSSPTAGIDQRQRHQRRGVIEL